MDIHLNPGAEREFDLALINDITPVDSFPIWKKEDPYGREYYGVANFCGLDRLIKVDTDLSWLEWDGNEIYLSGKDKDLLFKRAVGIIKSWRSQLTCSYPDEHFAILASYDDGSLLAEECEKESSFTLRFWKKRDGQGLDENTAFDQPVIIWSN